MYTMNQLKDMMKFELIQPWSTFVMKTKLPPPILEKMLKITDEIITNNVESRENLNWKESGSAQMKDEFWVEHKTLERENVMDFLLEAVKEFVIQQTLQANPFEKEEVLNDEWHIQMIAMWLVSQKDNEYQPIHTHSNCQISTVMYLKIPKYLPSRNPTQNDDGAIIFTNNASTDNFWGKPILKILPQVGDFYIFSGSQFHQVYPFRTADGKGERRSVSFNAICSSKIEQDKLRMDQEAI